MKNYKNKTLAFLLCLGFVVSNSLAQEQNKSDSLDKKDLFKMLELLQEPKWNNNLTDDFLSSNMILFYDKLPKETKEKIAPHMKKQFKTYGKTLDSLLKNKEIDENTHKSYKKWLKSFEEKYFNTRKNPKLKNTENKNKSEHHNFS